jgi:hypothetical protein
MNEHESADSTVAPETIDPLEVCTLDPDELAERLRWVRAEILSHALGKERLEDGIAIELSEIPGIRDQIDHWFELEGDCCGGIRFERHSSRTPSQVRIEIHGINPNGQLFGGVPDLLTSENASAPPSRAGRILRAGGLGAAASVLLFCVLPVAFVALLGTTAVAVPLSALDDPLWIGLGAVAAAGLIWWRMGRKERAKF